MMPALTYAEKPINDGYLVEKYDTGIYKVTVSSSLNLRSAPNINSSIITQMPNNTIIRATKTESNWGFVVYKGLSGWCSLDYAEFVEPILEHEEKLKVIDVSKWQVSEQHPEINWEKVKASGVDAAILRIGYRGYVSLNIIEDEAFRDLYVGAVAAEIPVGCYFYSAARNAQHAKEEAEFVLNIIRDNAYTMAFPVYIDIEDKTQEALGKEICTEIVNSFCETIEEAGYLAGIYCSRNWAETLLDISCLVGRPVWIAEYSPPECTFSGNFGMWQYSKSGSVDGIVGNVDLNWCYFDYSKYIIDNKLNGFVYHNIGDWETLIEPTCTKYGREVRKCIDTQIILESKTILPLNHSEGDWVVVKKATASDDGYQIIKCETCDKILKWELLPSRDDKYFHSNNWIVTEEPECEKDGERIMKSDSGIVLFKEYIPALTHNYEDTYVRTEPTKYAAGKEVINCTDCEEILTFKHIPIYYDNLVHDYGDWEIIKMATHDEEGELQKACSICGDVIKEFYVLGDIDRDKTVTAADARHCLRFSAGLENYNYLDLTIADYDFDGKISATDARLILRVAAGIY